MRLSYLYEGKKFGKPYVRDPREVGGQDADREGQTSKTVKRGPAKGASRGTYKGSIG